MDGKGEPVTTIKNVDKNITLVGVWKFIPVEDSAHRKVTFKDGEKIIATVEVEVGKTIEGDSLENQSMPKNPTKAGYTFKEWNTKADGIGTKFLGTTAVISDITVYAVYTKDSDPENPENPKDPQNPQNPQDPNNNSGNGSDTNDSDKSESDSINIPSLNLDNGLTDGSNSHENASYQSNNVNNQNERNNKSESLESSNSNQTNDSANSNKSGAKKLGFAKKNTLPKMGADNSLALAIMALITIAALTTLLAKFIAKTRR
ncbi:InlB B-repeat-containing protein [Gardnerella sp. KA00288]